MMCVGVLEVYNVFFCFLIMFRFKIGVCEVLVRVWVSGVNLFDMKIYVGVVLYVWYFLFVIFGIDLVGVVESIGCKVMGFKVGDEVYGMIGGVGGVLGLLVEFVVVDVDFFIVKLVNLSMW